MKNRNQDLEDPVDRIRYVLERICTPIPVLERSGTMDARRHRRLRWEQLFELAEAYLKVPRKGLAELLGRDPSRIIPES